MIMKKDKKKAEVKQEVNKEEVGISPEQCNEYLTGWKRALADYENLVRDQDQIKSNLRQNSQSEMVERILPVLDNFDQAVKFAPQDLNDQTKNWLQGILHIQNQLRSVLAELGAEFYGKIGEEFDPNLHQAIKEVKEAEKKDQEIVEVIVLGWKIKNKIIRPAQVIINNK